MFCIATVTFKTKINYNVTDTDVKVNLNTCNKEIERENINNHNQDTLNVIISLLDHNDSSGDDVSNTTTENVLEIAIKSRAI